MSTIINALNNKFSIKQKYRINIKHNENFEYKILSKKNN